MYVCIYVHKHSLLLLLSSLLLLLLDYDLWKSLPPKAVARLVCLRRVRDEQYRQLTAGGSCSSQFAFFWGTDKHTSKIMPP